MIDNYELIRVNDIVFQILCKLSNAECACNCKNYTEALRHLAAARKELQNLHENIDYITGNTEK